MMVLPPEAWTALGVAIGGAATAFFAWLGRFGEMRSQRQKSKIDYQQSQITALRDEIATLKTDMRNIESEARKERAHAYSIQDRARLALSMAASHISLLNAHILARRPPPAPPLPDELSRYIEVLLWSAPVDNIPPRPPPSGESTEK